MKKTIAIFPLLFLLSLTSKTQTDSVTKKYKHEIGADMTGLLKQFFNFNSNLSNNNYYSPIYYVSYRYHLNRSNIRAGLGGNYSKTTNGPHMLSGVEQKFYRTSSSVSVRIGYERTSELSRSWQAFYGLDFRTSITSYDNPQENFNGGYMNGKSLNSNIFGLAPLLGFRYRISNRLSVITETSFSFNIENYQSQQKSISTNNTIYPEIPQPKALSGTNIYSTFNQPIFILLVVDL